MLTFRWERVEVEALTFRGEETEEIKAGVPLELPITNQLAAILERRWAAAADLPRGVHERVSPPPTSATGHVLDPHHLKARIGKDGGAKFRFHGLRDSFIIIAQHREPAQKIADRIRTNRAKPHLLGLASKRPSVACSYTSIPASTDSSPSETSRAAYANRDTASHN